jgi:hypothetical protein
MGIIRMLFGKRGEPKQIFPVTVQLNAKIMPLDRGRLFHDPLTAALEAEGLGLSEDGGTLCSAEGEIEYCDLEVDLYENTERAYEFVKQTVERLGAPKGSKLHVSQDDVRPLGTREGLGLYLNGTELPDDIYKNCDSNHVHDELNRLVEGEGRILGHWQGPKETAFYLYGGSFDEMRRRIADFIAEYPLCQKCRVVRIA